MISDWLEKQGPIAAPLCMLYGLAIIAMALVVACVHRAVTGRWPQW